MESLRHQQTILRKIAVHVETMFGAGLLVTLPIGVTVLVLKFFFDVLDPLLYPFLRYLPGPNIPGLGVVTLLLVVYLAGLVTTQVAGQRLIEVGHQVMERIPVVKSIYSTTRTGVGILAGTKDQPYRGVVLVEFPRTGMLSIGLITAHLGVLNGKEMVAVYIPTTPVPSSGFPVLAPFNEVIVTEMSMDDAMKMVISGGLLAKDCFVSSTTQDGMPRPQTQATTEELPKDGL
jgi:uncharacterized membrane protein